MTINIKKDILITSIGFLALFIGIIANMQETQAQEPENTVILSDHVIEYEHIDREEKLRVFFEKYGSPLADYSHVFVEEADKYGLDYRLLPAIAGIESTFCRHILPGSYNCYGWGIYGNNAIYFDSYEQGIRTVAKGIHEGYVLRGADTPAKMAPIYTPPNHAKWLASVNHFMGQIQ